MNYLSGYKTYVTAIVTIISAVAAVLVGDMAYADAAQLIVTALLGAFVRNGIK
jgi:hypothetical protein